MASWNYLSSSNTSSDEEKWPVIDSLKGYKIDTDLDLKMYGDIPRKM